jgi:hypothetical protein
VAPIVEPEDQELRVAGRLEDIEIASGVDVQGPDVRQPFFEEVPALHIDDILFSELKLDFLIADDIGFEMIQDDLDPVLRYPFDRAALSAAAGQAETGQADGQG